MGTSALTKYFSPRDGHQISYHKAVKPYKFLLAQNPRLSVILVMIQFTSGGWTGQMILSSKQPSFKLKEKRRDFPGGPAVMTPHFHCRGHGFDPWLGELRSHMPCGKRKKKVAIKCTERKFSDNRKITILRCIIQEVLFTRLCRHHHYLISARFCPLIKPPCTC